MYESCCSIHGSGRGEQTWHLDVSSCRSLVQPGQCKRGSAPQKCHGKNLTPRWNNLLEFSWKQVQKHVQTCAARPVFMSNHSSVHLVDTNAVQNKFGWGGCGGRSGGILRSHPQLSVFDFDKPQLIFWIYSTWLFMQDLLIRVSMSCLRIPNTGKSYYEISY